MKTIYGILAIAFLVSIPYYIGTGEHDFGLILPSIARGLCALVFLVLLKRKEHQPVKAMATRREL